MATTKRSTKGRATASGAKSTARTRTVKKATTSKKPVAKLKAVASPKATAKPKAIQAKPTRAAAPKQAAKKPAERPEIVALKAKASRERNALERRLTDAVREIGLLRHHEMRAIQFERQLGERDATIGRLQTQLTELERRPAEPIYVREIQQTLALVDPVNETTVEAADLDEFEDDRLGEDADLASDEE
ncbi:MAG: hypothetical protein ABIR79_20700 [Candidatus Binatia bacterium]